MTYAAAGGREGREEAGGTLMIRSALPTSPSPLPGGLAAPPPAANAAGACDGRDDQRLPYALHLPGLTPSLAR